jgi:hypothetical protein
MATMRSHLNGRNDVPHENDNYWRNNQHSHENSDADCFLIARFCEQRLHLIPDVDIDLCGEEF